jgi:hypothetical protein
MQAIDKSPAHLHLSFSTEQYTIIRLPAEFSIPGSLFTSSKYSFVSVTKTPAEVSIILATSTGESEPPFEELQHAERRVEGPWTTIKIQGPMDLSEWLLRLTVCEC